MKKILKIAQLLGISPEHVEQLLGDKSSQLLQIASLTQIESLRKAYEKAAPHSEERRLAHKMWDILCCEQMQTYLTLEQMRNGFERAPEDSHSRSELWRRWNLLALQEMQGVASYEEAVCAITRAPGGSQSQKVAFEKLVLYCDTLERCRDAYNHSSIGWLEKKTALEKWNAFSRAEIDKAKTLKAVQQAIARALPKSEAEKYGYQRLVAIATLKELKSLYEESPEGSKAERFYCQAWETRALEKVEKAKTVNAFIKLLEEELPLESKAYELLLSKWNTASLKEVLKANTIEQLRLAYSRAPEDSEAQKFATEKIAALLPNE